MKPSTRGLAEERVRADVCVIGGGSGGIGAAMTSARLGARTVLVEREPILGGTSTMAWVHKWEPQTGADGVPRELFEAMKADPQALTMRDYAKGSPRRGGVGLPFEPHALNYAARELLEATGCCQVLVGTSFCGARMRGDRVEAVEGYFAGKRLVIEAAIYIDSTADGDLCYDAGCEYRMGEDGKSEYSEPNAPEQPEMRLNSLTLLYRIRDTGQRQVPYLPRGVKEGVCPRPVDIARMPNGDLLLNPVDMIEGNAVVAMEYGQLMREAVRRVYEHFHWLQTEVTASNAPGWMRNVPRAGFGGWAIAGIAPRIGVRETRRIVGDYVLTENDIVAGLRQQNRADIIAVTDHAVDIHGRQGKLYELPNGPYGVPFGCLLPKGVRNLMIASRAASFSHIAASSCRLSRTIMTLGEAAGAAAALCAKERITPREAEIARIVGAVSKSTRAVPGPG